MGCGHGVGHLCLLWSLVPEGQGSLGVGVCPGQPGSDP